MEFTGGSSNYKDAITTLREELNSSGEDVVEIKVTVYGETLKMRMQKGNGYITGWKKVNYTTDKLPYGREPDVINYTKLKDAIIGIKSLLSSFPPEKKVIGNLMKHMTVFAYAFAEAARNEVIATHVEKMLNTTTTMEPSKLWTIVKNYGHIKNSIKPVPAHAYGITFDETLNYFTTTNDGGCWNDIIASINVI